MRLELVPHHEGSCGCDIGLWLRALTEEVRVNAHFRNYLQMIYQLLDPLSEYIVCNLQENMKKKVTF